MKRTLFAGALALAFCAPATAQTCSASTFVRAATYPTGNYAHDIAVGDFTNDGKPDLIVVTSDGGGSLEVLPGNGDGTFGASIKTPANVYDGRIAVGYFNGDGNLDVAVTGSFTVLVFLGNGDGTFQPPNNFGDGFNAYDLIVADLDGNGSVDLAEASDGQVVVLLGNGAGGFSAGVPYPTPDGATALSITAGLFDESGSLDLAVALSDNSVGVFPGLGNGTFGTAASLPVGPNLRQIIAADLSFDGHLDIAVSSDTAIGVLHGNGDGTFQAAVEFPSVVTPLDLKSGDFDGDGRTDLAALGADYVGVVQLFLQQDDGSFLPGSAFQVESSSVALAVADLDGSGGLDFATANYDDVSVILSVGPESYLAITALNVPTPPRWISAGDFRAGGSDELVSLGSDFNGTSSILGWSSSTGFEVLTQFSVPGAPVSSATSDYDGDGNLDIAVATSYGGILVFRGNGDGSLQSPDTYPSVGQTYQIVSGDFTGDGKPDLVVTDAGINPGEVSLYVNNGNGTFASPVSVPLLHTPSGLVAADFDGDGHLDLAITNGGCCSPSDTISVLLGNGDGTFQPPVDHATGPGPLSVAAGDFDGDGHLDLVVADSNASNVSLLIGDGQGGFGPRILIAIGWTPSFIAAADIDGDGALDFVTANPNATNISLLLGNGHGQFQTPASYVTGALPLALAIGRFDGGAGTDIAVANGGSSFLTVLLNATLSATVSDRSVIVGSPAVLSASASGFGALSYQWRKNGVPLSDGGPISGSHTATLTIDPAVFTDAGSYDVVVTDSCTNATSNPATLSVEFDDVPLSNPFHADIITIATAGITSGCTTTSYCPSHDVSRAEMAVFLLKSKYGAGHVPPPPPVDPIFADVPADAFAAAWIDELASLGVTAGCGNGNYCPDAPVTRAEMAVFLLKTLLGSGYVPPAPTGIFVDVPSDNFAIAWIEDLYNRSITAGCGTNPLRYCPDADVPREQMATFLVRTFLP